MAPKDFGNGGNTYSNMIHEVCLVFKCYKRVEIRQLVIHCIGYEFRVIKLDEFEKENEKIEKSLGNTLVMI